MLEQSDIEKLEVEIAIAKNYIRNMQIQKRANGEEHSDESYLLKVMQKCQKLLGNEHV